MNFGTVKFSFEQLIFLAGIFLLLNFLFFVPDYYSLHFNTEVCSNVNKAEFSTENLPRTYEYYREACDSVIKGWKYAIDLPLTVRYHAFPAVVALLITVFYTYYRYLGSEYQRRGWKSERGT